MPAVRTALLIALASNHDAHTAPYVVRMSLVVMVVLGIAHLLGQRMTVARAQAQGGIPTSERDPSWPKPLPNKGMTEEV